MNIELRDIVRHPVTVLSAGLAGLNGFVSLPFIDALFAVVWSNVPTLFTASSVGAFTIAPNLGGLPAEVTEALQITAILLGLAYAGKLLYGVWTDAEQRFD